jgi:hypothetical protein
MSYPAAAEVGPIRAVFLDGYRHLGTYKPSNTTRTATTTLAADPHLTLPVEVSAVYAVIARLAVESPTTADFKWDWSIPAAATLNRYSYLISGTHGTLATATSTANMATNGSPGAGVGDALTLSGTLIMSSTAGSITLRWAQNTSDAGNTILLAGSSLTMVRIA